jgi:hypothetical protein
MHGGDWAADRPWALRGRVVGMVLRQGVLLSGAGLVAGLVGALPLDILLEKAHPHLE